MLLLVIFSGLLLHVTGGSEADTERWRRWTGDIAAAKRRHELAATPASKKDVYVSNLNDLGAVLHLLGCLNQSLATFERSIALQSHQPVTHKSLGSLLAEMFALEEIGRDTVELNPRSAYAYRFLGNIRWSLGDFQGAELAYGVAADLLPLFKVDERSENMIPGHCDKNEGQCCVDRAPPGLVVPPKVAKVLAFARDVDMLRRISGPLRSGHMVHLENALASELVDELYKALAVEASRGNFTKERRGIVPGTESLMPVELDESTCNALTNHTNGKLGIRRQRLDDALHPALLQRLSKFLRDAATLSFVHELTGVPVVDATLAAASFQEGDFLTPNSGAKADRAIAFVIHLTKTDPERCAGRGGEFVWCYPFTVLPAGYNTLTLFKVSPSSLHYVNVVKSSSCQSPHLAIWGWFLRARPQHLLDWSSDRVKPRDKGVKLTAKQQDVVVYARSAYEEATRLRPDDVESWEELGKVRRLLSENWGARDAFRAAAALQPKNGDVLTRLGRSALALGDDKTAVDALGKAFKLVPQDARLAADVGDLWLQNGEYDKAKKALTRATTLQPATTSSWNKLGIALERLGDGDPAEEAYRRAAALDPTDVEAIKNLGAFLGRKQNFKEAQALLTKAQGLQPDSAETLYNLGLTHVALEENKMAKRVFERVLKLDPGLVQAELELGTLLMEMGDFTGAKKKFMHYLKSPKADSAMGHYHLGLLLERTRDMEGAKAAYQKSAELGYQDSQVFHRLGVVYRKLGDLQGAKQALEQVVKATGAAEPVLELSEVLEELGDTKQAKALHKKYLHMVSHGG